MPLTDPKPVPKFGEPGYVIPSQERKKREKKMVLRVFPNPKQPITYLQKSLDIPKIIVFKIITLK